MGQGAAGGEDGASAFVHVARVGAVVCLALAHPPVNALAQPLRLALWRALEAADADAGTHAIVLHGQGRGFCAGGDFAELNSPLQQAWPGIAADLLPRIEACGKPVIAALHGFAIGGGLELALACHHRVAHLDTRIALPEVKHGLVPPSGSQRLPRAIGAERALQLMVHGDTAPATAFAGTALFDRLVDGDPVAIAVELGATRDPRTPPERQLLRHRPLAADEARAAIARWRTRVNGWPHASLAMRRCIDAVACALHAPDFDAGLRAARRLHLELAGLAAGRPPETCP